MKTNFVGFCHECCGSYLCIMNTTREEIQLPPSVENRLMELYQRHMLRPIDATTRSKLRHLGEEKSVRVLTNLTKVHKIHNLNAYITYMVNKEMMSFEESPSTKISSSAGVVISGLKSPCQSAAILQQTPLQPLAIGEVRLGGGADGIDDLCDEALLSIDIEKIITPAKRKVSGPNLFTNLKWIPIFEWSVVRCGCKNRTKKASCV